MGTRFLFCCVRTAGLRLNQVVTRVVVPCRRGAAFFPFLSLSFFPPLSFPPSDTKGLTGIVVSDRISRPRYHRAQSIRTLSLASKSIHFDSLFFSFLPLPSPLSFLGEELQVQLGGGCLLARTEDLSRLTSGRATPLSSSFPLLRAGWWRMRMTTSLRLDAPSKKGSRLLSASRAPPPGPRPCLFFSFFFPLAPKETRHQRGAHHHEHRDRLRAEIEKNGHVSSPAMSFSLFFFLSFLSCPGRDLRNSMISEAHSWPSSRGQYCERPFCSTRPPGPGIAEGQGLGAPPPFFLFFSPLFPPGIGIGRNDVDRQALFLTALPRSG